MATGVVAAGEAMLRAVDDAVAALADGYQSARRRLGREQEGARRRFLDDLLEGGSVSEVIEQAPAFGVSLTGPHVVIVATREPAGGARRSPRRRFASGTGPRTFLARAGPGRREHRHRPSRPAGA